jgi:hypothetical protein
MPEEFTERDLAGDRQFAERDLDALAARAALQP